MNADGSSKIQLTNPSNGDDDYRPSWSPDGSKIAFVRQTANGGDIYVMNADGSNPVRLTNNTVPNEAPRWKRNQTTVVRRGVLYDFDGDGKADQSVFRPSNSVWYSLRSNLGFTATQFGIPTDRIVPADFDGDGKTDIAVFRDGVWYMLRSQQGFGVVPFGTANDKPIPAAFVP